ncbi:MAG: HAD family hydrolase [Lactobacillaceae bacterium]|jgi:phosphoglycolate phosphatase-like HAD superfamily hydrolase|nr:HAD family hydrolase [Lactobacillaceae bacterium]
MKAFDDVIFFEKVKEIKGSIELPDVICFDLFGTMIDSLESDRAAIKKIVGCDVAFPLKTGKTLYDSLPELVDPKIADKAQSMYVEALIENANLGLARPYPNIDKALNYLWALDVKVLAITNRHPNAVRPFISKYPEVFRFVGAIGYGSVEAEKHKPNPEIFNNTLKKAGLKPTEKMWMVGDAVTDIEFARNCNMKPIMMGDNFAHNNPKFWVDNQDVSSWPMDAYERLELMLRHKFSSYEDYEHKYKEQAKASWGVDLDKDAPMELSADGYTKKQLQKLLPNNISYKFVLDKRTADSIKNNR